MAPRGVGVLSGAHCSVLLGAEGGRFSLLGHFIIASQSILRNINEMQKFRVDEDHKGRSWLSQNYGVVITDLREETKVKFYTPSTPNKYYAFPLLRGAGL